MTTLAGVLFLTASAAGWLLILLVTLDVLRYRAASKRWRPSSRRDDGGGPI